MYSPKNKGDLISYYIEYPGKPENIQHKFKIDSKGEIVFTTYRIPDVSEFEKLASGSVKHFVNVPDFWDRLKDIIETTVKLRLLAQYIQFDVQEQKQTFRTTIQQKIHKIPFQVVMPDGMSKKDRLKYKKTKYKLDHDIHCFVNYSMNKIDVVFDVDEKANDFLAIIPNYPFALKASLDTNKKMKNVLAENANIFSDFTNTIVSINEYCDSSQKDYTQKSWDDFLFQSHYNGMLSYVQENVVNPPMMHLVDCTRRFLCEALVSEHGLEIASTKALAFSSLKEDKQLIYKLAEKYGYIKDADSLLFCEDLRNQIAHPEENTQDIIQTALRISKLYTQFVFHYLDKDFITDYYNKIPVSFPLDELNVQYQAYQRVRQAEIISNELSWLLPENLKHGNNRKKISFLDKKGIISHKESEEIKQLFLKRNEVAHGQMTVNQAYNQQTLDTVAMRHALVHRQHV